MHTKLHIKPHTESTLAPIKPVYPAVVIKLPKGIRLLPTRPNTPSPFGCTWSAGGRRKSQFFSTKERLETKLRELIEARKKGDIAILPTRSEIEEWRAFKAAAGAIPAMEILAQWRAGLVAAGKPVCDKTVTKAVDEYLARETKRKDNGNISADTLRQRTRKLTLFKEAFGFAMLDAVTAAEIEDWIDDLDHVDSASTFTDYVKKVRGLYTHFADIVPKSPADRVELRSDLSSHIKVYQVEDAAKVLLYVKEHRPELMVRVAMEIFVGIRFTTAALLQREHIKISDRRIDIPAALIKTRRGRNIDAMPAVFWEWATLGWDQPWDTLSKSEYMHRKSELFGPNASGITAIHNGFRHTFASMHVAKFNNPGLTATILCHRNQQMLHAVYLGKATKEQSDQYFGITPARVAQAAAGVRIKVRSL